MAHESGGLKAGKRNESTGHATLRITAAVFGSLAVAFAASVCIGRAAPFSFPVRFAMAHYGFLPLWITGACFGFTAKSGVRAWVTCAVLVTLLVLAACFGARS